MLHTTIDRPVGRVLLVGRDGALFGLGFQDGPRPAALDPAWRRDDAAFAGVTAQLEGYFAGDLRTFDVALDLAGSPFQRQVWQALREIPYGKTTSYGALADRVGRPGAARAVGLANGRNPVAVIVPCHRAVGADGSLTGFGGGMEAKRRLLDLECGGRLFA